ncbi:hypothetical protein GCK72_004509 [Caenorhabditis remanei]|uniref:Protein kinase domain-containing protein n=1 Tax=Caenorhabditis remanei TaxID=31234 RepID=A0A6A5H9S4_CAERE|nr:hypothetical protein GCK72_004509 [Caenorhabditis remanei]KAF1764560.1 hypothetical protein GCK72_004509 [Caenorhabditis remanei]
MMNAEDISKDKKKGIQLHVGDQLAKGSFSTTFLATTVPELSGNYSEVAKVGLKKHHHKYAKEQEILHVVNGHKHFPRLVYAGESPKFTYIVTEYGGEDLKTVCERNRFGLTSNKNVIRLAHRLHGAVGFLHTKNFFHRDMKAENVLIELRNQSVRVKLCDFGDASDIREPGRRRSSFLNFFLPAALQPYYESEDHLHTSVMCLKLLKELPYISRRQSLFWASHIRVGVKLCDFGDSSEIKEPERRRSSFFNFFHRPALPPFHLLEDHCHTAILCLKLLTKIPHSSRRKSFFSTTHITTFKLPALEEEHDWIKLTREPQALVNLEFDETMAGGQGPLQ